jgi:glutathione S-transferase
MKEALVLYGEKYWYSPYVYTAWVALKEKGLAFEEREHSLYDGGHKTADFYAPSLTGRVPALRHGDFWLAESSAIVEYLEDAFPETTRIMPWSPRDRARARQLMAWIRSDLMPLREERPTTTMFYARADKPMSDACKEAADKVVRVAEAVVPKDGGDLFGAFSIADADLAFVLQRLVRNEEPISERLRAYANRVFARPSVKSFLEHPRPPTFTG